MVLSNFDKGVIKDVPEPFKSALIDVCDTAGMVSRWFRTEGIEPSPSDIVAMTALVMARVGVARTANDN